MAVNKAQVNQWTGVQDYADVNVRTVPAQAGLYCLLVKLKDNRGWRPFYIGQADDLQRRLMEHRASWEQNLCIRNKVLNYVCGFQYLFVSRQSDRDRLERQYIEQYKPECNTQLK